MTETETYTNRYFDESEIAEIHGSAIRRADGLTHVPPKEVLGRVRVGDLLGLEMIGGPFGVLAGWQLDGEWLFRKSDQQIERERQEYFDKVDRDRREQLEESRADWTTRTEALPDWLQERIQTFRERGGQKFEVDGWGYELVICELAVLYDADPNFICDGDGDCGGYDESQEIKDYAEKEGTSGNQHDCAKALVRMHRAGESLAGTVSGLTPLTGDPFFEGRD